MGEEVPVLGGQDRAAEDRRHVVVRDDAAVLARQLDKHGALGVVDLADRRHLEPNEALEIGQAAPVEVDVVDEAGHRDEDQQRQERRRQDHAATRAEELHVSTLCGPGEVVRPDRETDRVDQRLRVHGLPEVGRPPPTLRCDAGSRRRRGP